jgi:cyclophilin family peptidyl-prolyl cis-trans isomerase
MMMFLLGSTRIATYYSNINHNMVVKAFSFTTTTTTTNHAIWTYRRHHNSRSHNHREFFTVVQSNHNVQDEPIWQDNNPDDDKIFAAIDSSSSSRRDILHSIWKNSAITTMTSWGLSSWNAWAVEDESNNGVASLTRSTEDAEITNKIYIDIQGLPSSSSSSTKQPPQRIVIGLFGKEAPEPVQILLSLVSPTGWDSPCRPKVEKLLQKEQLEANKVYNACIEQQNQGVTLKDSTIWRIFPNQQFDIGAVSGRFLAREYPNYQNHPLDTPPLRHDRPGIVSVRRGNEGGFGFTIYYFNEDDDDSINNKNKNIPNELDSTHIVVGKVLEGLDVLAALNRVPVVTSSKLNFMALTGERNQKAPDRSCRYGSGNVYCNENKPLIKISIGDTGVLS